MPKYKVGDVAALFPKPKEPTTEAGKKLESLFKQFHTKKNKSPGFSYQNAGSQTVTECTKTENENERPLKKNKKRKFADTETLHPVVEEQKLKKFKQEEPEHGKNSILNKKKKKFPTEQGFPRNKKLSNIAKNKFTKSFNELNREEIEHDDYYSSSPFTKEKNKKKFKKTNDLDDVPDSILSNEVSQFLSEQGFSKNKNKIKFGENIHDSEEEKNVHSDVKQESDKNFKSKNKKQKAIFIKKSKKTELVASNHNIESKDNKKLSKGHSVFKNEIKDLIKNSPKDLNKCNEHGFKQSSKSSNSSLNPVSENKDDEKLEVNDVESFKNNSSPSKNVEDFVRNKNFKKKISNNNFVKKSEQEVYGEERDFIKVPDIKSEVSGDELSRTLFVGNLPLDTKRKALKKLFSPFGEIENIRFHGNETDKAKIFSEDGYKTKLNPKKYAADSVPGYIVFKNKESAVFALSLSGSLFKDHHITVDFASPAGSHKQHYDDKRSIFIGNLSFDCKDDSVWEALSECGRIENVRIVRDKETGIGKGFGFVQFNTVQSKENALSLKDLEIQGRHGIRVKEIAPNKAAQNKTKDVPVVKRSNTFKSHAIRLKKKSKDSTSRKSVAKIMKKQKKLHEKKKISSILQKSMKK